MVRLYVVRHGETDLNVTKRIQGPLLDPPLNARGRAQAQALARRLSAGEPDLPRPDFVLSSSMRRAAETAEPVVRALAVPWEVDDGLVEYDWGELNGQFDEGATHERLKTHILRWGAGHVDEAPPGGESPRAAAARALAAVEPRLKVVGEHGILAVVAHGRINKVLLASLLHGSPARQEDIHQHNVGITVLERSNPGWRLVVADDHSHVTGRESAETV